MLSSTDLVLLAIIYSVAYGAGLLVSKFWSWLRFLIIFISIISFYEKFDFSVINLPIFIVLIVPVCIFVYPSLKLMLHNPNNPISKIIGLFTSLYDMLSSLYYKHKRFQLEKQERLEREKYEKERAEQERQEQERQRLDVKNKLKNIFNTAKTYEEFEYLVKSAFITYSQQDETFIFYNIKTGREYDLDTLELTEDFYIFINNLGNTSSDNSQENTNTRQTSNSNADPYEILGVDRGMSLAEIKGIYNDLAKIYHPDHGRIKNAKKFDEITQAYKAIRAEKEGKNV